MPPPGFKPDSLGAVNVTTKNDSLSLENLAVNVPVKEDELHKFAASIGLKNNEVETQYIILEYKDRKKGLTRRLIVTAFGVTAICRLKCKSVVLPGEAKIDYFNGHPRHIIRKAGVTTMDDRYYENEGCIEVEGSFSIAYKHAVTNAKMRALRDAFGLDVLDESEISNLSSDHKKDNG